ncbi:adenosine deaminase family protein [Lasiosphaeria miniovina]|uniref:adenosine deaminase n=1 Tax=Lasiosphaeria miniovina TaxID=1954250 RepID=A0AA40E677_9PEZI|nr:adenosine deaminase family protein [Lasiosphaeria miniovina]KAK0728510.1 adenosine deaminase family protein [Lasiosphaeria miniovina]
MPPISDEDWADVVSKELPSKDDAVIQKYLQNRQALIDEEKKQRSDYTFRQRLSPIAKKACDIVDRIRDHEKQTVWTSEVEEQIAQQVAVTVHPGMMFSLAKEKMESTNLWKIVRRMPKGALLHSHCDAMVDFDYILELLLTTPGMHIACPGSHLATAEARKEEGVSIQFRAINHTEGSLWKDDYKPGTFVLMTKAADDYPDGGRSGFLEWLKSRCTINQADALEQHHGVAEIWRKFVKCFEVIGAMIHYEPIWRAFLQRLMSQLVEDGVYWVEIRFAWPPNYCREGCEEPEPDYNHMFQVIEEEVAKFQATEAGQTFWGLRMIWTALRGLGSRPIVQSMDDCIATKLAWPHLLAGFDLVGPEDAGRPLADLLPELFWFRKQCALEGANIPFFFHAGETLGDGDSTDQNLFDALLLGTRRIGHGFSLFKHPRLIDAVKDKRILVESCPISNEILRLTGSIMQHPLPALLARGVPCALCNDDPAILGQDTAGMTHDFWQALQGWENLGLAGLGSLAENSVRWAAFEDQDSEAWTRDIRVATVGGGTKAAHLRQWAVEWELFCVWIVTEYGETEFGEKHNGGVHVEAMGR